MATNRKEAAEEIEKLKAEAEAKLKEATDIADKFGVAFSWDFAYGMGGYYQPSKTDGSVDDAEGDWESSGDSGWQASSESC